MNTRRLSLSTELSRPPRVAVIVSRTNEFVTERLLEGAISELRSAGCADVTVVDVAGSFELVAAAAAAFDLGAEGVVTLGAVIRGETPHFEYICTAVANGLAALCSEGRPVTFGVLTTDDTAQAAARAGGALGNKGAEAARALLQILSATERMQRAEA